MTPHAIVVDDNRDVLDDVSDRLESMGHTCDLAETQSDARKLLEHGRFSYALLDLEIPVRYGSPCRIGNGKNLLREMRSIKGLQDMPVIVMTAHGHGSPRLAVDVMKHSGAVDFVMKPFSEADPPLEEVIEDVLRITRRTRPGARAFSEVVCDPEPPQPFKEGEMVFSETRVELCGVRICDGRGSGLARSILDVLREKDGRGMFIALSGEELARRAGGAMTRQNDIADAIRRLRERIQLSLLEQANVRCTRRDVVSNDRRYGYRLTGKITIRDVDDVNSDPNDVRNDPNNVKNDPNNGEDDVRNDVRKIADDVKSTGARQEWILGELEARGEMRKDEVFPGYKNQFGLSKTTLERDLNALRRRGLIRFDGERRTGHWRRA